MMKKKKALGFSFCCDAKTICTKQINAYKVFLVFETVK